jgi:hypothetical protein
MIFQALDDKGQCVGIYAAGELTYNNIPDELTRTWDYAGFLKDREIEYAKLFCGGKSLDDICPEHLFEEWQAKNGKLKAFLTSFREAKVSLQENCFFELVPQRFLVDFCEIKNKITEYVLQNHEKPKNYEFLRSMARILDEIKQNELDIDLESLKSRNYEFKVRQFIKKVQKSNNFIDFDLFGTITGRLSTKKGSFPILTMDKEFRSILKPKNDCFLEFDFNAAELRTLLTLSGQEQPEEDLHEWNSKHIYRGLRDREESKKRIFAWLYNPESRDYLSEKTYDREKVKQKYWDGSKITNYFGREIEADDHHALNYIIQSTTSDLLLRQMCKIFIALQGKKSFIAFPMHDSLIIDLSLEDKEMILPLMKEFQETELGTYKTNVRIGKHYGEMKKYDL